MNTNLQSSDMALLYLHPNRTAAAVSGESILDRPLPWWVGLAFMLLALNVPLLATTVPPLTDYPNHLARCYLLAFGESGPGAKSNVFCALANHPQYCRGPSAPYADACVFAADGRAHRPGLVLASAHERGRRPKLRLFPAPFVLADCRGFRRVQCVIPDGIHELRAGHWNRDVGSRCVDLLPRDISSRDGRGWYSPGHPRVLFPPVWILLLRASGRIVRTLRIVGNDFRARPDFRNAAKRAALLAITLVLPTLLYFTSPLEQVKDAARWPHIAQKAANFFGPFLDYSSAFDILTIIPLIAFLMFCVLQRRARISAAALIASVVLLVTYILMPRAMKGTYFLDIRLPIMLGFMVFAGFMPKDLTARQRTAAAVLFAALFVARIAFITDVWMHSQRDLERRAPNYRNGDSGEPGPGCGRCVH